FQARTPFLVARNQQPFRRPQTHPGRRHPGGRPLPRQRQRPVRRPARLGISPPPAPLQAHVAPHARGTRHVRQNPPLVHSPRQYRTILSPSLARENSKTTQGGSTQEPLLPAQKLELAQGPQSQ